MNGDVVIVPATLEHVRAMAPILRDNDRREILCAGLVPHREIFKSWKRAVLRRTALVDGELAAMWGVGGALLGYRGRPWLVTAPASERISPLRFARIYREQALQMKAMFPLLESYVDSNYTEAVRLARLVGFSLGAPQPLENGAMVRRIWMGGGG